MPKNRRHRHSDQPSNRAERLQADAAEAMLANLGLSYEYNRGGTHLCVVVAGRRIPLASSPSDETNAVRHLQRHIQRLVRELNLDGATKPD